MRAILSVRNSFIATKEPVLTLATSLAGIGGKEGDNSIGVDGGSGRDGCVYTAGANAGRRGIVGGVLPAGIVEGSAAATEVGGGIAPSG